MPIHPTAIVSPAARIAETAEIGPYSIVGAEVEIGAGTRLMAHVYMEGPLRVGEDNVFFPYSTVGVASQDLKYHGERAETRIGDRNKIREFVTIHRGTEGGGLVTSIGDDNLLMAYVHVAHDVHVGNRVVLANAVTLGGHVTVGDWAVIGASTGVHQFCRIGRHAIIGGYSVVTQDVLPFSNTVSERGIKVFGANRIGPGAARIRARHHREAADRVPPVDARGLEHFAGRGADSRGDSRVRRGGRTAGVHRRIPARSDQVDVGQAPAIETRRPARPPQAQPAPLHEIRADRRQRPLPASWRWKTRAAWATKWWCWRSRKKPSPEVERLAAKCHWISLGQLSRLIEILKEEGITRSGDGRAGEARQNLLVHPAGLAAGQAAGVAAVEKYRRADRRSGASARRRRHSASRFDRAAEAAAGRPRRDDAAQAGRARGSRHRVRPERGRARWRASTWARAWPSASAPAWRWKPWKAPTPCCGARPAW